MPVSGPERRIGSRSSMRVNERSTPARRDAAALIAGTCRDDPEHHLVFDEDGVVVSSSDRGQATISVVGLNREGLVASTKERGTSGSRRDRPHRDADQE